MKNSQNNPTPLAVALAAFLVPAALSAASFNDVYPIPQSVNQQGSRTISATQLASFDGKKFPALAEVFKAQKIRAGGNIKITLGLNGTTLEKKFKAEQKMDVVPAGAYWLKVSPEGILISALDEAGVFYATQTLAQMIELDGKIACGEVLDWADIPFRGTVEGYYGDPWSPEARKSQFKMYGKYKINTYIYGPKNDPYHHGKWRENYPKEQAETLREQIKVARENHVNFVWAIHLGGVFNTNDKPAEYAKLLAKLEFMYGLGVRAFGVFFDDFGGNDATLHSEICNYVTDNFIAKKKDCPPLVMCPTQYNKAWSGGTYLNELGDKTNKNVNIMWTGNSVCTDITRDSTDWISERIKRSAFIWWNWPCTDYCRTALCMGRTYGLEKGKLSGITGNPMDKPEASKLGIFGIGNWAWNVDAFDSEKTWRDGVKRLFPTCASAMQIFVNHNSDQGPNGHGYRREESVEFLPTIDAAKKEYAAGGKFSSATQKALVAEFKKMSKAGKELAGDLPNSNPRLYHEIEHWVKSFAMLGVAGANTVEITSENSLEKKFEKAQNVAKAFGKMEEYFLARKQRSIDDATFERNKQNATGCKVGALHVMPFVENTFATEWAKLDKALGGNGGAQVKSDETDENSTFRGISNVPVLANMQAVRDGKYVNVKVLEQITLAPKQYIGIGLPTGIFGNYVHVKLNNPQASKQGIIEVSRDGATWKKLNTKNSGEELQSGLDTREQIRFFRYINTSAKPIDVRMNQFKFDIPADARMNSAAAMTDGDPRSGFEISKKTTIPAGKPGAKKAYVLSSDPERVKTLPNGSVEVSPAKDKSVKIFEIIWK